MGNPEEQSGSENPDIGQGEAIANELRDIQPEAEISEPEGAEKKSEEVYLLGGKDYEMARVKKALDRTGTPYEDLGLDWEAADIDRYREEIQRIIAEGNTPVAVELRGADQIPGVVEIDHHNEKSDRPASISQVLERIDDPGNLADRLAAANDAKYYAGMEAVVEEKLTRLDQKLTADGYDEATRTARVEGSRKWLEMMIQRVRSKDREAQGVTPEMEAEAEEAIDNAERGPNGLVTVKVTGDRPSPVTDRLHYTWPNGKENLVVVCNSDKALKEVWFFGAGDLSKEVRDHFVDLKEQRLAQDPQTGSNEYHAWGGGSGYGNPSESAFCGVVAGDPQEVINYITSQQGEPQS